MSRISRRRRCAPASLSPPGILESARCRGRGGRRDREPRRRRNPQGGRRRPSAPRKAARGRDEQRPDGRVVPLSDGAPDKPEQTMPTSIDFNTIDKAIKSIPRIIGSWMRRAIASNLRGGIGTVRITSSSRWEAYRPLATIAHEEKAAGFNSVRIAGSSEGPRDRSESRTEGKARAGGPGSDRRGAGPGGSVRDPGQTREPRRLVPL